MERRQPIGVELVKRGVVNQADIEKALEYQRRSPNRRLGDILYILELCDPKELIKTIGEIVGTPGILLEKDQININIEEYITLEVAKKNKAIPFEVSNGKIKICFADNANNRHMDTIRLLMLNRGIVVEPYITFESNIDRILKDMQQSGSDNFDLSGQSNTITELVDNIIKTGIAKRASDIHFEPMEEALRVRYRIDGELFTATTLPKNKQNQIIGRLKAISNMHEEMQESQDGRILLYEDYNIRVSSQKNIYGEKFVLRLLKKNSNIKSIFELGFPGDEKTFKKTVDKRNSMTIVAAPTGEGKTTTLYSIIDFLNRPEINITTIEDPVEIRIKGLNQIEIDSKATFSDS